MGGGAAEGTKLPDGEVNLRSRCVLAAFQIEGGGLACKLAGWPGMLERLRSRNACVLRTLRSENTPAF